MADQFIIAELPAEGHKREALIEFRWDSRHRSIPVRPWDFPMTLRTKRVDYPGTTHSPTEQVLGANFEPFTLEGRWSDKWNFSGFAVKTLRDFETVVESGRLIQITFQDIFVVGLITGFSPSYHRREEIKYSFTVSPHHRQPNAQGARSPRTVLNATQLLLSVQEVKDAATVLHDRAPRFFTTGSLYLDVDEDLNVWDTTIASIDDTINQRVILPNEEPGAGLGRLAALFTLLRTTGEALNVTLREVKSSVDLGYQSALNIMNFDVWAKGIDAEARRMGINGERASRELKARAQPNAIALYRPHENEHLYKISNRFYGTPHNWRRIATRNNLGNEMTLLGTELLIIPEATSR